MLSLNTTAVWQLAVKAKQKYVNPSHASCNFGNMLYEGLTVYSIHLIINSSSANVYTFGNCSMLRLKL